MLKLTAILAAVVLVVSAVQAAPPEIPPPDTFIPFEVAPQPLPDRTLQPAYPEAAKAAKLDATVVVMVYVWTDGSVQKFRVIKETPSGYGFGLSVAEAIPYWRFTPALNAGKPVGVWIAIPFSFSFKDSLEKPPSSDRNGRG